VQPGIYDIGALKYHADPAAQPSLSSSIAKILITQSPRHAWLAHPRLNPNYVREEDSRFDLGTAAHAMLLERRDNVVWVEADDWRTKAAREMRDTTRALGRLPLLVKYKPVLQEMVAQAALTLQASELGDILTTGKAEQTLVWKDGDAWCRARLDLLSADRRVILDYKSTENAEPEAFIRQIGRLGYDVQAGYYTRGLNIVTSPSGVEPTFIFLAQEITPPYECSLIALSNAYREIAQAKVARAIRLWSYCLARNEWPGYGTQIRYAEPTAWQIAEAEAQEAA